MGNGVGNCAVRYGLTLILAVLSVPVSAQISQNLPVTAKVKLGGQVVELEVARSALEQQIGMMGRKELSANRGMLFIFDQPRMASFWMGNCYIPLDMVFIRKGKVVNIAENALPCPTAQNCPNYTSKGMVDQVLELKGGQAKVFKLKANDSIDVNFFKSIAQRGFQ